MKLSVALFFAGLFGALAAVFILLSFGSDYWLQTKETCIPNATLSNKPDSEQKVDKNVSYNEGFFWGCYSGNESGKNVSPTLPPLLQLIFAENQPDAKICVPAYLKPYPMMKNKNVTDPTTGYDPSMIFRGFWSVFMLISVAAVVLAGFFVICGAPFASHCLYKTGGGLFLASGFFLLCDVVMYVLWFEFSDVLEVYVEEKRSTRCPTFNMSRNYGLSFIFAPIGIFFCFLAGLLFILIGRTVQKNYN